jgi:hypothetical protein
MKREKILAVMNRLDLQKTENGLLTYAVLEELWDEGLKKATELIEAGRDHCILNDKGECTKCLGQLLAELNIE